MILNLNIRLLRREEYLPSVHRLSALAVSLVFLFLFGACTGEGEVEVRVVATVDGRPITNVKINNVVKAFLPEGGQEFTPEEVKELRIAVLAELIEEELSLGSAAKAGLTVSDEELSAEIGRLKENYDEASFQLTVTEKYGSVRLWREEVRRKLLVRKVVGDLKGGREPITDETALKFYNKNIAEYDIPEQVRARMILLDDEERAKTLLAELTGETFAETARKVSIGPEAEKGGDLGFFGRDEMPEEFEKAIFALEAEEISEVVTTPYGHHIFFLEERKKGRKLAFEDVKVLIKARLARERDEREYRDWMKALRKEAKIEIKEEI